MKTPIKRLALVAALLIASQLITAQCGTFGNYPPPYNVTGGYSPNYLLGTKHTLTVAAMVTALGYQGNNTGAGMQMALYTDNSGSPGNLVGYTGTTTVGSGNINIPLITPTSVPAGDYWIMAIYNANGNHVQKTTSSSNVVSYISLTFGATIPSTVSSWITYTGQDFNYWATLGSGVTTQTTGVCPANTATLAVTGGTSYAWNTGPTTPSIVITPSGPAVYTVIINGALCSNTAVINVTINPTPPSASAATQHYVPATAFNCPRPADRLTHGVIMAAAPRFR